MKIPVGSYENSIVRITYSVLGDTVSFRFISKLPKLNCELVTYGRFKVHLSETSMIKNKDIYLSPITNKKCFRMYNKNFLKLVEVLKFVSECVCGNITTNLHIFDNKKYFKHWGRKCFILSSTFEKLK